MKDMKRFIWTTRLTGTVIPGILLSLFLLASCSREGDAVSGGETRARLAVAAVSLAAGGDHTNTRAAALPSPVTGGSLWVGIRAGNGYAARTGIIYNYSGGAWTSAAAVPLGKDPVSLYAYWPQGEYPESGGTVTLTTQPYAAGKDLGYALSGGENVCSAHPWAGFVLNHAYARVKTDITFSPYFEDSVTLNAVYVSAGGLRSEGALIPESGTHIPGTGMQKLAWTTSGQTVAAIGRAYAGDMLAVPSPSLTGARLVITLGDTDYSAGLGSALTTFEAGKSYLIKAEVKPPALVITRVEVEDWTTGPPQSGDAQFE